MCVVIGISSTINSYGDRVPQEYSFQDDREFSNGVVGVLRTYLSSIHCHYQDTFAGRAMLYIYITNAVVESDITIYYFFCKILAHVSS